LGCDPFNFADAMQGVLAKRLCKRLCTHCKEPYHPSAQDYEKILREYGPSSWESMNLPAYGDGFTLYRGRGCDHCRQTGYKGRVALHELLRGTDEMKTLKTAEMTSVAKKEGMITLMQDGILKVLGGTTTYDQVRAVAMK
jgi:type II secretory ATPase GspE/PulE/Tfp pilus assembly ATPase PilB-like protein